MNLIRTCFVISTALALVATVQAQQVWRCGEGGRTYSESPCPGGRLVSTADPRSTADAQAAREGIKRSQDLAARMREERLQDERRNLAANAMPANLGPRSDEGPAAHKVRPKSKALAQRRQQPAAVADGGTWPATAAVSRRKRD